MYYTSEKKVHYFVLYEGYDYLLWNETLTLHTCETFQKRFWYNNIMW